LTYGRRDFATEDDEAQFYLEQLRDGSARDRITARDGLARIFERRGLLDEAAECLETNILEGVRDRDVYERLARIYRRQGRAELADEVIDEARRLPLPGSAATQPMGPIPSDPTREGRGVGAATRPMRAPLIDDFAYDESPTTRDAPSRRRRQTERPWYKAPAIIILSIVLLGPIGLALMWAQAAWRMSTKWIVTGIWWGAYLLLWGLVIRTNLVAVADIVAGQAATPPAAATPVVPPTPPAQAPAGAASPPAVASKPSPAAAASPVTSPGPAQPPASKPAASAPQPGSQVRVANTDGDGVNLRERPSSNSNRLKLVAEGAILDIVGPDIPAEDKIWRNVRDSAGATGWVVSEFLVPVGQ
jgi:Bacterial SH3 domain